MSENDEVVVSNYMKDYSNIITESGIKFISPVGYNKRGQVLWECECGICHKLFNDMPLNIISGHKKSCGCLNSYKKNRLAEEIVKFEIENKRKPTYRDVIIRVDKLSGKMKDYTGYISKSGVKINKPLGKNFKNQMLWECECGLCGTLFIALPIEIIKNNVKSCGCLLGVNSSLMSQKITYSFYDWCIDNKHSELLDLWDYDKNNKTPNDVAYKSNKKYWFKCINHNNKHQSELKYISHIVEREGKSLKCIQCNSFAQWGLDNIGDDFLEKYWDYDMNTNINPWNISCGTEAISIYIKCQNDLKHKSYKTSPLSFKLGSRCPLCSRKNVEKETSLGVLYPKSLSVWSDKNDKTPYEFFSMSHKEVWWKCPCGEHNDYKRTIGNAVAYDFRCPLCSLKQNSSRLQRKVADYVCDKYRYTILNEYKCNIHPINPKTNYILPYDNELVEIKLIIEVHGEQHYIERSLFNKRYAEKHGVSLREALCERQWIDNYKKQYALSNGYDYLEIPYTFEKNDLYKTLIDDKINKILNKKTIT